MATMRVQWWYGPEPKPGLFWPVSVKSSIPSNPRDIQPQYELELSLPRQKMAAPFTPKETNPY